MPKDIRLVIFDCDLTLWNYRDATLLLSPFVRVAGDKIRDQGGTQVSIYPQVRSVLAELDRRGYLLSICSWNKPEPVFEMLSLYGLRHYFRHPKAEYHPGKAAMIARMLEEFAADGVCLAPEQVVFIDDRTLHTADLQALLPGLHFLQMWVDLKDHAALLPWLDEARSA